MFDNGHIFPPKTLWFGEKSAFLSQKSWCHAIPRLFRKFSENDQNITLQLRQNSGETYFVTLIHQNMSKIGCVWAFSHFSVFEAYFLRTLNSKSAFLFVECGMKYPKWPIYATSVQKTELSNLTKNKIVLPPKHGGGWEGGRRQNSLTEVLDSFLKEGDV